MHKIKAAHKIKELPCNEKKSSCHYDAFDLKFYNHIKDAKEIWDQVAPENSTLLSSRYMQMMERYAPKSLQMRYIIVFRSGTAIGIIPCALKRFEAKESILLEDKENKVSWFKRSTLFLRFLVVEKVAFNTLICGNIFFSGEYAFYFNEEQLDYVQQFNIVEKALMDYQYHLLDEGMKLNVSFMKDFYVEKGFENQNIESSAFNEFKVQPSMHLDINKEWTNFEEYLASFHSKARVRARKAFKRGEVFEKRTLSFQEVKALENEMFSLYKSVSENAGFNLFELPKDYFTGLRKELGECMKIQAYFIDGKLVSFFTGILD